MSAYLPEFIAFATVHIFSLISPGPDFLVVLKNSLSYSRKTALFTALGICLAESTHVFYALVGMGLFLSRYPMAMHAFKYIGAAYLVYIGYHSLKAKRPDLSAIAHLTHESKELPALQAFRMGFITNALNIKASFFTISCFAVLVSPSTPMGIQLLYALFIVLSTFVWFAIVAFFLTHSATQKTIYGFKHWIERTAGAVLILFGIKLAFSDLTQISKWT